MKYIWIFLHLCQFNYAQEEAGLQLHNYLQLQQPITLSTVNFINRNITVLLVSLGWFAEQVEGLQTLPPKQVLNIDPFSHLTNKGSSRYFENRANTSAKFQP